MISFWKQVVPCGVMLAVAGCAGSGVEVPAAAARAVGDVFVTASVMPAAGGTTGGTVRLIDLPTTEDMTIEVSLTGAPPGPHAWHIHTGTCAMPGAIVVPFTPVGQRAGIDEAITAGANGMGSESAQISGSMLTRAQVTASPHVVNIHANGPTGSPGPGIACAELR